MPTQLYKYYTKSISEYLPQHSYQTNLFYDNILADPNDLLRTFFHHIEKSLPLTPVWYRWAWHRSKPETSSLFIPTCKYALQRC